MKTMLIVFGVLALLYLLLTLGLGKLFSLLILKAPKRFRPTYDEIRQQKVKEIGNDKAVFAGIDWKEFDTWETEPFTLQSGNITIRAELYPVQEHKGVVICAHGFGQNKLQMAPHAALYRELGFSTVLYDQRHWGESSAPFCSFGYYEADDLACLARWAKNRYGERTPVIVTGVSMGGATVMNALSRTDCIDYAIDDCGFAHVRSGSYYVYMGMVHLPNPFVVPFLLHDAHNLGIPMELNNPADSVAQADTPLLVIHGDADRAVSVQDAYEIGKAAGNSKSRVEIFPGIDHGYCLSQREKYKTVVTDFLKDLL
jgi:hypothetical protein